MNWQFVLCIIALIIVAWSATPVVWVLRLEGVPKEHRRKAALFFINASLRGLPILVADLLAPIVVPIALLQTKWESEQLPRWARWWDNDVGLNGDNLPVWHWDAALGRGVPEPVPLEDTPEVRALCYWAKGHHPRSFWARFVWIGLRNRASMLALMMGYKIAYPKPVIQSWGDEHVGRDSAGWQLREHNGCYQLYAVRKLGPLAVRTNYGGKVYFAELERAAMPVVCIAVSFLRWKGLPTVAEVSNNGGTAISEGGAGRLFTTYPHMPSSVSPVIVAAVVAVIVAVTHAIFSA